MNIDQYTLIPITSVEFTEKIVQMYDIEVDTIHCFNARHPKSKMHSISHNSAMIALGDINSDEYINLKNPDLHQEELYHRRWASNNSIYGKVGVTDYEKVQELINKNGEPGIVWLDNCREYGRFISGKDYKDMNAKGVNPCSEMVLENAEICNLIELFPSLHDSVEEFYETLKYAYLYGKSITLINTKSPETNAVMLKNRRIGLSLTGIMDTIKKIGRREFLNNWCDEGYNRIKRWDDVYSDWLCIPKSKRTTTVKPSGCCDLSTTIKTTDGIKSMQQIFEENDIELFKDMEKEWIDPKQEIIVFDKNNDKQLITKLYINGIDNVYEFQTEDGEFHYFTGDHKFFVKNKQWVKVKDLEKNDDIISY